MRLILLVYVGLTVPTAVVSQVPTGARVADSLVSAKLGVYRDQFDVRRRLEWTQKHDASPSCGDGYGICLWPWHTAYELYFFEATIPQLNVGALIVIPVDTAGRLIPDYPGGGLPDCATHPTECHFPISADSARSIGRSAGLAAGVRPWDVRFVWIPTPKTGGCDPCGLFFHGRDDSTRTFAWLISVTESASTGKGASGRTFVIDANSAEVLVDQGWLTSHH